MGRRLEPDWRCSRAVADLLGLGKKKGGGDPVLTPAGEVIRTAAHRD